MSGFGTRDSGASGDGVGADGRDGGSSARSGSAADFGTRDGGASFGTSRDGTASDLGDAAELGARDGGSAALSLDGTATTDDAGWRFGIGLGGGISSGATSDVLPNGVFLLDATYRFIGVALEAGLTGSLQRAVPPATIVASSQWLTASARFAVTVLERVLLEALVGARFTRVAARATGVNQLEPEQTALLIGGAASLGATVRIAGPLGVFLRATAHLFQPARLIVTNIGSVDVGPLDASVQAGAVLRL